MDLSTDVDFLSGVLQLVTGERIVSQGKDEGAAVGAFDLDCLHKRSLQWRDLSDGAMEVPAPASGPLSDDFLKVFIRTLNGEKITGMMRPSNTVEELKSSIQDKQGIPVDHQRLFFDGLRLENVQSLASYNIQDKSSLHLALQVTGGGTPPLYFMDPSLLDPQYNYDFTDEEEDGSVFQRGGWDYTRPYGWNRVALNVKYKFESTAWLGGTDGGIRTGAIWGEWPVSYHGTKRSSAQKIVSSKYDMNRAKRFRYGRGIYSTPDPQVAEKFARVFYHKGRRYKVLIQNRVNMEDTCYVQEEDFYITLNENSIRPYGILFKEF